MATATVRGGSVDHAGATYNTIAKRRTFGYLFGPIDRELTDTLLGAAPGGTATVTRPRVKANTEGAFAQPVIEQQTLINRATTIDDRADLRDRIDPYQTRPRVANLDGNGYGRKGG